MVTSYKTISELRKENIRPLQKLFREFVKLCKKWDLVGGEFAAIDGSKFKASKGYYNGRDLIRVKKQKILAIVAKQNP